MMSVVWFVRLVFATLIISLIFDSKVRYVTNLSLVGAASNDDSVYEEPKYDLNSATSCKTGKLRYVM